MKNNTFGWDLEQSVSAKPCLKQGDLIVFPEEVDETRRVAIVVTADCDLERKKHANLVTLVPVVTEKLILERYLLPDDCTSKIEQIRGHAMKECGIDKTHDQIVQTELLLAALEEKSKTDHIAGLISDFIADAVEYISVDDYKSLMSRVNVNAKKSSSFADQIGSRGDLMILPDASELDVSARIAWVRHVWQIPAGSIALKNSDVSARPGERRARLSSPFRYRLTQLMGQVFTDIGLPDVPVDLNKNVSEVFGDA